VHRIERLRSSLGLNSRKALRFGPLATTPHYGRPPIPRCSAPRPAVGAAPAYGEAAEFLEDLGVLSDFANGQRLVGFGTGPAPLQLLRPERCALRNDGPRPLTNQLLRAGTAVKASRRTWAIRDSKRRGGPLVDLSARF
jgi:hypothetical protein